MNGILLDRHGRLDTPSQRQQKKKICGTEFFCYFLREPEDVDVDVEAIVLLEETEVSEMDVLILLVEIDVKVSRFKSTLKLESMKCT